MPASLRLGVPGSRGHPPITAALRLDPCISRSASSTGKCDKAETNADWVPHRTPLAVVASTQPSSSSAAMDRDATGEDGPSAQSSTLSRTCVAEVRRASSSGSTSHHVASSTPSCLATLSRRSSSRARPDGCPRRRSQILTPSHSSCECHSSSF
jgi:hypothetical protein